MGMCSTCRSARALMGRPTSRAHAHLLDSAMPRREPPLSRPHPHAPLCASILDATNIRRVRRRCRLFRRGRRRARTRLATAARRVGIKRDRGRGSKRRCGVERRWLVRRRHRARGPFLKGCRRTRTNEGAVRGGRMYTISRARERSPLSDVPFHARNSVRPLSMGCCGSAPVATETSVPPKSRRRKSTVEGWEDWNVSIPDGVEPGGAFALQTHSGRMTLTCPPHKNAGDKMKVMVPALESP